MGRWLAFWWIGVWALGAALGVRGEGARPVRWQEFYSYTLGKRLLPTGRGLLMVCDQAILEYGRDGLLTRYSTVQGLAGANLVDADYDMSGGALVVAYADGTIDIAGPSERFTITELRDAVAGSVPLPIERVAIGGKASYALAGTHLLRLARKQGVRIESLRVWRSDNAYALRLHDACVSGDQVYVGTSEGVYVAKEGGDGSLGRFVPLGGLTREAIRLCASPDGRMLAAWVQDGGNLSLMLYESGAWLTGLSGVGGEPLDITSDGKAFWVCNGQQLWRVNHNGESVLLWDDDSQRGEAQLLPQSGYGEGMGIFIASRRKGLVRLMADGGLETLSPHSPTFGTSYRIALTSEGPIFTGGGYTDEDGRAAGRAFGLYHPKDAITLEGGLDAGAIALIDGENNHYLVGTSNQGLVEIAGGVVVAKYDASNTPMQAGGSGQGTVCDVVVSPDGAWWVLTQYGRRPLLHRNAQGEWRALPLPARLVPNGSRMALSSQGNLWIACPGSERMGVINPDEYLGSEGKNGSVSQRVYLPSSSTSAAPIDLTFDTSGTLWLATDKTLLLASDPDALLKQGELTYSMMAFPDPDWSIRSAHHLTAIQCTSVLVDAGDNVWVGTVNGDVYHLDPVSKSLVKRYEWDKTPLPRGRVHDMAYDDTRGMVYVAGAHGVVALRGESQRGAENYRDVRVYPNPLRPNMPNEITIDGLKRNSIIKITDSSGDLVRELRSLGGRAVWDVRNGRGRLVQSGIYLVFISDESGKESTVERVAIVR